MMRRTLAIALSLAATHAAAREAPVSSAATRVHERVLTLDTHLDTPASLALPGWSILDAHDVHTDYTQVDLPRMKHGGLDGGFFAIYTPQGPLDAASYARARDFAVLRALAIREMVARSPQAFERASTAADASRIAASGKRVVYMSIENAYPLGNDVSLIRLFHAMGVRLAGFAHFGNNQFADSSTDAAGARWNGLSPLGIDLLAEMNRLGIVADASHSSDRVLDDLLRLSRAPIILSHSGCKAVFDHPRNVDDARLRALAAKGGVIQINAYAAYLKASKPNPERTKAFAALFAEMGRSPSTPAARQALLDRRRAIDARYPDTDRATFDDVMAHMLHALQVVGVEHVGIGLDWDGGGGVTGMEDVTAIPRITEALLKTGYSESDIAKIWSGNILRVMEQARVVAATTPPLAASLDHDRRAHPPIGDDWLDTDVGG